MNAQLCMQALEPCQITQTWTLCGRVILFTRFIKWFLGVQSP